MEGNLAATLQLLKNTPRPVAGSDSHGPDVIMYSDIMKVIKVTLYDPMKLFPQLADLLTSVSNGGSGAGFATFKMKTKSPVCLDEPSENVLRIQRQFLIPYRPSAAQKPKTYLWCPWTKSKLITIFFVNRVSGWQITAFHFPFYAGLGKRDLRR
jgi:hypothetical protein